MGLEYGLTIAHTFKPNLGKYMQIFHIDGIRVWHDFPTFP